MSDWKLTIQARLSGPEPASRQVIAAFERARSAGIESLSAEERAALEACSRSPAEMRRVLDKLEDDR